MNDCISARVFYYDFTNPQYIPSGDQSSAIFWGCHGIYSFLSWVWLGWWKQPSRQTVVKPLSGLFWLRPFQFEGENARVRSAMRPGTHKWLTKWTVGLWEGERKNWSDGGEYHSPSTSEYLPSPCDSAASRGILFVSPCHTESTLLPWAFKHIRCLF